jgi:Xaa-Pro aminopeptidase
MNKSIYKQRRDTFLSALDDGIAILAASDLKTRSNDTEYPYRQESNFYYLSGIREDHCVMVFNAQKQKSYLFVKEVSEEEALWVGSRMGVEGAKAVHDFDEVFALDTFDEQIKTWLKGVSRLYFDLFSDNPLSNTLRLTCKELLTSRGVNRSPRAFFDVFEPIQKMRLIKSDDEITLIRKAISITKEAHHRAMRETQAGMNEFQIEAELEYVFAKNGAAHNAYDSIVAGGNNANVLHYIDNNETLEDATLLLIDAGCEYEMYASDITRTFPVNGSFTAPQRELYEMVLHVQLEIIKMITPGITKKMLQDASERMLCEGMIALGILKGESAKLIEDKAHKKYFPHGIGHWLGMDVHDPCPYVDDEGEQIFFQAGMVLTIEPGIYIRADNEEAPERYRGIGIRIEDNILVTESGCENLSQDIVKSVEEIEQICRA